MSLTLKDLRVVDRRLDYTGHSLTRPASLADLVEVLKQEGQEIELSYDSHGSKFSPVSFKPGRYLVLPLGDTP